MDVRNCWLRNVWSSRFLEEFSCILNSSCVSLSLAAITYYLFGCRVNFVRLLKWWLSSQRSHKHLWRFHERRMHSDDFFYTTFLVSVIWLLCLLSGTCMWRNFFNLCLLGLQRGPLYRDINLIWWFICMLWLYYRLHIWFSGVRYRTLSIFLVPKVAFNDIPVHFVHLH